MHALFHHSYPSSLAAPAQLVHLWLRAASGSTTMLAVVLLGELRSFCVESCRRRFVSNFASAVFFALVSTRTSVQPYHERKNETLHRCTSEELDLVRSSVAWTVYRTIEDDGDDLPTDFRVNDFVFLPPHGQRLYARIASMARHILDHERKVGTVFDTIVVVRPDLRVYHVPLVARYSLLHVADTFYAMNRSTFFKFGEFYRHVDVCMNKTGWPTCPRQWLMAKDVPYKTLGRPSVEIVRDDRC